MTSAAPGDSFNADLIFGVSGASQFASLAPASARTAGVVPEPGVSLILAVGSLVVFGRRLRLRPRL